MKNMKVGNVCSTICLTGTPKGEADKYRDA